LKTQFQNAFVYEAQAYTVHGCRTGGNAHDFNLIQEGVYFLQTETDM
jgi:hypothetical protein